MKDRVIITSDTSAMMNYASVIKWKTPILWRRKGVAELLNLRHNDVHSAFCLRSAKRYIARFQFLVAVRSAVSRLCQRQQLAAQETTERNTVTSHFVVNQRFQVSQYVCSIESWRSKYQSCSQQTVSGTKEVDPEDNTRASWRQQPHR